MDQTDILHTIFGLGEKGNYKTNLIKNVNYYIFQSCMHVL